MSTNAPVVSPVPSIEDANYDMLTPEDLLLIARDTLRGRESDHFRLSLLDARSSGGPDRLRVIEGEIAAIKNTVHALEAQVDAEAPE